MQNYAQLLDAAAKSDTTGQAASLKANLDSIVKFRNGVKEYTDSVKRAAAGSGELYSGIDDMKKFTEDLVAKEFVLDIDNLTSFIKASDNARIAAAAGDVIMNKIGGIIAGVIVLILFAYVISVFVVHQIEQESGIIGALYSLGVKKKDLLRHYITIPTIAAFIGGLFGTALGFTPFGISLIKIFGYRPKEIRSLYLNGNLIVVAVGGLAAIPLAKFIIDLIYPTFVANVACCMSISYDWYIYVALYCTMMLVYLLINKLLMRKISKITPAQVLKNRE